MLSILNTNVGNNKKLKFHQSFYPMCKYILFLQILKTVVYCGRFTASDTRTTLKLF